MRRVEWLLVPFFFAVTGAQLDLGLFGRPGLLVLTGAITLVAVAGKLVAGAAGARSLGGRSAFAVGVGMTPRGEVGILVASVGLAAGAVGAEPYAAVIGMSILTTLLAPPALKGLLAPGDAPSGER